MKMKSMADIMKKTSVVALQEDDLPSSSVRRPPPQPQREVRVGLRLGISSSVTRADDVTRARNPPPLPTKRCREVFDDDDDASRASKKKKQHVAEPSARAPVVNTARPTLTRTKEAALARCSSAARRADKNRKDGERRQSRESVPATSRPPPAQDVLSAAIAWARVFMDKRAEIAVLREEARREVANMVRTVEFNDPYISVADVFKP